MATGSAPALELEGRRLVLRALRPGDAEALREAVESSREALRRRLRWAAERDPGPSAFIARCAERAKRGEGLIWGVFESRSGRLAGVVSLAGLGGSESAEMSGWVRADRQDRGLAT